MMHRRTIGRTLMAAAVTAVSTLAVGAGGVARADNGGKQTIRLSYVQSWPSSDITTHIAAAVIEQKLGQNVHMIATAAGPMWQSVASGHADAMLTAWLPTTHKKYYEKLWQNVVNLGPNLMGTKLGLAVPKYVPVNTIAGLEKHAGKFRDRIIGVGAGAGININTKQAIKTYHLSSFNLQASSTAAMAAQLKRSIREHKWIVVTAWSPLWIWAKFDLKYLKDPKNVYGTKGHVNTIVNPSLAQKSPQVYAFLRRFEIGKNQLQNLMLEDKNGTPMKKLVADFLNKHPKEVQNWLS